MLSLGSPRHRDRINAVYASLGRNSRGLVRNHGTTHEYYDPNHNLTLAAAQRAVGQILRYMGDVAVEEEGRPIRGILVASEFDGKAKAAARIVSSISLRRYSVRFMLSDGQAGSEVTYTLTWFRKTPKRRICPPQRS